MTKAKPEDRPTLFEPDETEMVKRGVKLVLGEINTNLSRVMTEKYKLDNERLAAERTLDKLGGSIA